MLAAICVPSSRVSAQDPAAVPVVALPDVLRRARRDPPAVLRAHAEYRQAQAEHGYQRGAWLPSLTGQATAGYTYDNRVVLPGVPRIDSQSIDVRGDLTLDWAALDVARGSRIDAAEASERARGSDLEAARERAAVIAAELYLRAGAATTLVKDAELSLERRSQQFGAANQLVEAGTRSPVDVQRARIEVLSAEYALAMRKTEELAAFAALAAALGLPADRLVRPAANTASFAGVPESPARAREIAVQKRPELRGAAANVAAQRHAYDAAVGERWPRFGAQANGTVSYSDVRSGIGIDGTQYTGAAGVYLRWQGFDPAIWQKGGVADAAASVAERERAEIAQAIGAEAVAAYYVLERAKTQLRSAVAVLEAAEVTREAQNGRYVAGLGSLLELLDAEEIEQLARQRRIEAERDEAIASAQLLSACGSLVR